MYCNIGKLEFEVEKISLVPKHIGGGDKKLPAQNIRWSSFWLYIMARVVVCQ